MSAHGFRQWIKAKSSDIFVRPSERYKALDGIRALSIILIVVFHCWVGVAFLGRPFFEEFNANIPGFLFWITKTDFAVDAFFVMSGFLIGTILLKELERSETINLKDFYIKRLYRIYPAYLLLIVLYAIPLLLSASPLKPPQNLLYNVFYVSNFLPSEEMPIGWSWTLCVEEQFYILMPLILLLSRKYLPSTLTVLLGLYVLSYFVRLAILLHYPQLDTGEYRLKPIEMFKDHDMLETDVLSNKLHSRYGAIITGVIGAYLYYHYEQRVAAFFQHSLLRNNLILIAALLMVGLMVSVPVYRPYFYQQDHRVFNLIYNTASRNIFSLGIMLLIFCSIYPKGLSIGIANFLGSRVWYPIAQLSYSTYLFHLPFVGMVCFIGMTKVVPKENLTMYHILVFSVIAFLLSSAFAVLVFTFVERPFMAIRDRFYKADKLAPTHGDSDGDGGSEGSNKSSGNLAGAPN